MRSSCSSCCCALTRKTGSSSGDSHESRTHSPLWRSRGVDDRGSTGAEARPRRRTDLGGRCQPQQTSGDDRVVASGSCVKNGNDACTSDADCSIGGCGGELCGGLGEGGISTCECAGPEAPVSGCGCVN